MKTNTLYYSVLDAFFIALCTQNKCRVGVITHLTWQSSIDTQISKNMYG